MDDMVAEASNCPANYLWSSTIEARISVVQRMDATSEGEALHSTSVLHTKSRQYRSIITDIFDGGLESSVQCLTCNTVSKTQETFQDLSLPIPSGEVREGQKTDSGWISWAWGWLSSNCWNKLV